MRGITPLVLCLAFAATVARGGSENSRDTDAPPVAMAPYVVEGKNLTQSGFAFKATFRKHLIWAGIKELTVVQVEPRSAAAKAGIEVGDKIVQIRDLKVEGLKIKQLREQVEKKCDDGKVPLVIHSKASGELRNVEIRFEDTHTDRPATE